MDILSQGISAVMACLILANTILIIGLSRKVERLGKTVKEIKNKIGEV